MPDLHEHVAVVTGAGAGIGRGIARRFARDGARVVVAELDPTAGQAVADELFALGAEAVFVPTDVTSREDDRAMVAAAVDRWGRVDVLVNNAWGGRQEHQRTDRMPDEAMAHGWDMNVMGPFWAMQAAFPHMRAGGYGRIVNVCSLNGVNAHMGTVHYNASKEALRTMTRTAAREWAPYGITANAICPGAKTTAFTAFQAANPEMAAAAEAGNPMGRMGDPEADVAPAAAFLASDGARYVTGNTLFVDGGSHINGVPWAPDLPDD